MVQPPEVNL